MQPTFLDDLPHEHFGNTSNDLRYGWRYLLTRYGLNDLGK